ncbi:MAG: hypothetical protein R3183_06045, partial [Oleiphilaceae bacterium]|nr:hypothetical protein [Oleiphilaceae bacterium]
MKFKAFLKNLGRAHLLKRVCFYSFVFGCALSAIFSTITASFEYLESKAHLEQCFNARLEQDIAVVGRAVKFNDKELAKSAL